jgi:hypothetical protein
MKFNISTDQNGRYVIVFPAWGKYLRGPLAAQRNEMRKWCKETFKDEDWEDDIVFGKIIFVKKADVVLFVTKFS